MYFAQYKYYIIIKIIIEVIRYPSNGRYSNLHVIFSLNQYDLPSVIACCVFWSVFKQTGR